MNNLMSGNDSKNGRVTWNISRVFLFKGEGQSNEDNRETKEDNGEEKDNEKSDTASESDEKEKRPLAVLTGVFHISKPDRFMDLGKWKC